MKKNNRFLPLTLALTLSFATFSPALGFDLLEASGRQLVSFESPNFKKEVCVLPNHPIDSFYSEQDATDEAFLCRLDYYGTATNHQRVAVCPKINSTNPGLNLLLNKVDYSFPTTPVNCKTRDSRLELIAKHKQSISCSYTPSILSYYHLSRRFGRILNIPVAVIRTVDKAEHFQWTQEALSYFSPSNEELIYKNWLHFYRAHSNPAKYPQIFTRDQNFLYGALILNALDEKYYGEVSGKGDYATRELRFQSLAPFQKVSDARTLEDINSGLDHQGKLQNLVQMKDVSDMVLMDYLLNQADRIGNIHYIERFARVSNGELEISATPQSGSVRIKQMILKDNDCGVVKENRFKKFGILEKVRHMSPQTYQLFLSWVQQLHQPEYQEFLKKELLLTSKDLLNPQSGLLANANEAAKLLMKNCRSGFLKLDVAASFIDHTPTPTLQQCDPQPMVIGTN